MGTTDPMSAMACLCQLTHTCSRTELLGCGKIIARTVAPRRSRFNPNDHWKETKLKPTKMILGLTFALAFAGSGARGQTNSVPSPVQAGLKTYRLTYTLTETDGGKRVGTQHFAMIVVSGRKTVLKQGNRVPLVTGSVSTSGGARRRCSTLM